MPNWVSNTLTIEGNPSTINQIKNQLNKPFSKESENWDMETMSMKFETYTYTQPIFAFWNIIQPTDMVEYQKQSTDTDSKLDWYTWNVNNWGCKWDVAVSDGDKYPDTQLLDDSPNGENHVLVYQFNTPWGVPQFALQNLSSQYPTILFTNNYEEETGWGGEDEYINGRTVEGASWNWQCLSCDYMVQEDPADIYCEECENLVCPVCNEGAEEGCQTHMVESNTTTDKVDA